jgi:hypothetical protein
MKKLILIIISVLLCLICKAPGFRAFYLLKGETIQPYEKLIKAITFVESANGKYTYNKTEKAVGWFQIRQIRVDDYNRKTGKNYKLEDFYDYELSKKCFLYFANDRSFEVVVKSWNGRGRQTEEYWKKVKKYLVN